MAGADCDKKLAEEEWGSVRALAALAGATQGEIERFECIDRRDGGSGIVSCLVRGSSEPCPICWAVMTYASTP